MTNTRSRMFIVFGFITTGICIVSILMFILLGRSSFKNITPQVTVNPQPALLNPQEFLQSNRDLAQAIGDLNAAESLFLKEVRVSIPSFASINISGYNFSPNMHVSDLGGHLQEIAARAMSVSMIASKLGNTAASQDGASDSAMQLASQYFGVSRYSAALVIEAQNVREGLANGTMNTDQAYAVIAVYSARLWNPVSADLISQAQIISIDQITNQLGGSPQFWMASSADMVTVNLTLPNSTTPLNLGTLSSMTTVEGQVDANKARQFAAGILAAGGDTNRISDQPKAGEVSATFSSAMAVSTSSAPAFANGTANVIVQPASSNDVVSTLLALDSNNTPSVQSQIPIQNVTPVVTLTISNIVIKQVNQRPKDSFNTFEADVNYEFDVQWQANLAHPQFTLECVSGNHFDITTASGSQHISAKGLLILFPGAEDAYCYASRNSNTLGSASVNFLVGDSAKATQRVFQVETDSVSLDITLTADALGTLGADLNNVVASQAVIGTGNALSTEVVGTQNAEFLATVTEIARQTQVAVPLITQTPLPTPTFVPVLVESLYLRGDQAALSTTKILQRNRLYQFCFSGLVYLTDGPAEAFQLMHVNGISVPVSGCLTLEGTGAVGVITCGHGTSAEEPGGYSIQVIDLGPW